LEAERKSLSAQLEASSKEGKRLQEQLAAAAATASTAAARGPSSPPRRGQQSPQRRDPSPGRVAERQRLEDTVRALQGKLDALRGLEEQNRALEQRLQDKDKDSKAPVKVAPADAARSQGQGSQADASEEVRFPPTMPCCLTPFVLLCLLSLQLLKAAQEKIDRLDMELTDAVKVCIYSISVSGLSSILKLGLAVPLWFMSR
jgi:hypothetical protein